MSSEISVIICSYTDKRRDNLVVAVESVQHQTLRPKEIIVVIDHNRELFAWVQEHLPEVIVIENKEARGISGARNTGIAIAKGNILAFLDDDAVATPDWLASFKDTFSDPDILGVGGSIMPLWSEKKPSWLPEEFYWVVGCTYRGMPKTASKIRNLIGANMVFRREVFESVGGFRNEIGRLGTVPLGCEETEFCIRAHQLWPQKSFWYQPATCVSHHVPGTRANWNYFFSRCYSEGVSKAFMARYVGANDGLASERAYTLHILPLGIIHGLRDTFFHRDPDGIKRAWAILAGLTVTTVGYIAGKTIPIQQSRKK